MRSLCVSVLICVVLAGITNLCSADIIVSFSPSTPNPLTVGSTGTIDVLIHSNSSDVLDGFLFDIRITPTGGAPAGGLQFSATQNDSQLADSEYVFYQISQSENTGSFIGQTTSPFDVYSGFDFSDDGSGIALPGGPLPGSPSPVTLTGDDLLLARLDLTAFAAGTYAIDMLPSSEFGDEPGNLFSFDSTPGLLTVNGTAAVPEPGSVGFLSIIALIAFRRYRMQSKNRIRMTFVS